MKNRPVRLYVHIPFCVQKCCYCDFLSFRADEDTREKYVRQLINEIRSWGAVSEDLEVQSLFFGGGTPSVLTEEQTADIMDALYRTFAFAGDAEISTETNPGTLTAQKLNTYYKLGFNRLSMGLQSANDRELKMLGRIHDKRTFLHNFEEARNAGFDNINVDLISAIPGQTLASWEESLRFTADLSPEHISAYSLILEEGTPLGDHPEKWPDLPDEDTERFMYARTEEILSEYGYQRYEISNYAKPGKVCRHNIGYWTGDAYIGFGLGASSCYGGQRFTVVDSMEEYLKSVSYIPVEKIGEKEAMEEFMILGLRLCEGVSKEVFESRFGRSLDAVYGDVIRKYKQLELLEEKKDRIALTREGISVSNTVLAEFLL